MESSVVVGIVIGRAGWHKTPEVIDRKMKTQIILNEKCNILNEKCYDPKFMLLFIS